MSDEIYPIEIGDEVTVIDDDGNPIAIRKVEWIGPAHVRLDNGDTYKARNGYRLHNAPGRVVRVEEWHREELANKKTP